MSTESLLEVNFTHLSPALLKEQKERALLNNDKRRKKTYKEEEAEQIQRNLKPNRDLEQGKILPEYLQGDVEKTDISVPLVDPDPYYKNKNTYILLNRSYSIFRFTGTPSLYCFGALGRFRKYAAVVLAHPYFNFLIMLTILVNCVFMAMNLKKDWTDNYVERVFLAIYTLEMLIKISARGFVVSHFTYMRDPWNLLDIVVIFTAYMDVGMKIWEKTPDSSPQGFDFTTAVMSSDYSSDRSQIPGMAALRAFRVLRALKAISAIPGLKAIVSALIESVKALKDVMILTLFCLAVFALVGLQLFKGSLRQKCVITWPPGSSEEILKAFLTNNYTEIKLPVPTPHTRNKNLTDSQFAFEEADTHRLIPFSDPRTFEDYNGTKLKGHLVSLPMTCHPNPDPKCQNQTKGWNNQSYEDWIQDECNYCFVYGKPWLCRNTSISSTCQRGYSCYTAGGNPDFGYTNFDDFPYSFLALFRLMAQDYWENLYQLTIRANGQIYLIFFMIVIFLGSFYLINLILAVVAMAYEEQHQIVKAEEERKKAMVMKKKQQLEEFVEEVGRAESRLTSRRTSHNTDKRSSGLSSPESLKGSSWHTDRSRRRTQSSSEKQDAAKAAREVADRLAVEIGMNGGGTARVIESHPHAVVTSDALEQIGQLQTGDEQKTLPVPLHPGILKSGPPSPRILSKKIQMQSYATRNEFVADDDDDDEQKEMLSEKKQPKTKCTRGVKIHPDNDSDHADDEYSERASFTGEKEKRKTSTNSADGRHYHVTYAKREHEQYSALTKVDKNGVVTLISHTSSGLPEVTVQKVESEPENASVDSDFVRIDALKPYYSRSRLSSIDMLSEKELAYVKQRALSQASIIGLEMAETEKPWKRTIRRFCIWNCCWWEHLQSLMEKICNDPFFDLFIIACILVNTGFMAAEYEPITKEFERILETSNTVFTAIFCMEMIIKMIGLHPYYYFQDTWNCFDATIVSMSLIEFSLQGVKGFSVLRTFRLMRVFKLAKSWPTLNTLIKIIGNSMGSLGNLTFILIIILFIFAVVGMQLFNDMYKKYNDSLPENEKMRWHMIDFEHSFLVVFRILCGEWIETMWDCMKMESNIAFLCVPVFLLVQVVGNLVVLNLFLALLLSSFSADSFSPPEDEPMNSMQLSKIRIHRWIIAIRSLVRRCRHSIIESCRRKFRAPSDVLKINSKRVGNKETAITLMETTDSHDCYDDGSQKTSNFDNREQTKNGLEMNEFRKRPLQAPRAALEPDFDHKEEDDDDNSSLSNLTNRSYGSISSSFTSSTMSNSEYERIQAKKENAPPGADDNQDDEPSLCWPEKWSARFPFLNPSVESGCSRTWWNARKICFRIVEHSWFESFIILMILLSSGALAFEDVYLKDRKTLFKILKYADRIFTFVFIFEMLLKWVGYGFRKYFTNAWCWLDFLIVGVSVVSFIAELSNMGQLTSIRSLRTLRSLRPLRAMSRFEGMKVVVNALVGAIPSIFNVLLVCLIFWLIFSIVGVNLFAGKFFKCVNLTSGEMLPAFNFTYYNPVLKDWDTIPKINKSSCEYLGKNVSKEILWQNGKMTFDNSMAGCLSLLQVATFKGWMPIMYDAVDITEVNQQPQFENSFGYYYYFVAFIVFGSFFTLNLFIGVIIDNFNQQKKKLGGQDIFMTEEQRKYYNAMKKLGSKKPQKPVPKPKNKFQAWIFEIVTYQMFEITIMVLIVANMLTMMVEYYDQPESYTDILEYINYVFVAIFTGEAIMKLFALRHHYFKNAWNIFDFVVVILSIIGSAMSEVIKEYFVQPTIFRIIRLVRIGRILRLIKGAKGIRTLLFALMMSLPALINIGLLLILVMFIYSIFGMSQFAYVHRGDGIDDLFNFETFFNSFLCLFMITTSAGWAELLSPMLDSKEPYCNPHLDNRNPNNTGNCGNPTLAIIFFVTYLIFTFLIVVNMYIAIILENFGVATEESTDPLGEDDFEMFYEVWERFDPKATQFIDYASLSDLVDSLAEPLRVPKPNSFSLIAMDLPMVINDRLHCLDVLFALTKRVLGESEELEGLRSQMEEKFMASNPSKVSYEPITTTSKRKQEEMSAIRIQRWWRVIRSALVLRQNSKIDKSKNDESLLSGSENTTHPSQEFQGFHQEKVNDEKNPPPAYNEVMSVYQYGDFKSTCKNNKKTRDTCLVEKNEIASKLTSSYLSTSTSTEQLPSITSTSSIPSSEATVFRRTDGSCGVELIPLKKTPSSSKINISRTKKEPTIDISSGSIPTGSDSENNNQSIQNETNANFLSNTMNNEVQTDHHSHSLLQNVPQPIANATKLSLEVSQQQSENVTNAIV